MIEYVGNQASHNTVDERSIGFHQVIGKAIWIIAMVVVKTQAGMQPRRANGAGDRSAQDGIPVVEKSVLIRGTRARAPSKIDILKKCGPIDARRLSLDIVGVAGANPF